MAARPVITRREQPTLDTANKVVLFSSYFPNSSFGLDGCEAEDDSATIEEYLRIPGLEGGILGNALWMNTQHRKFSGSLETSL